MDATMRENEPAPSFAPGDSDETRLDQAAPADQIFAHRAWVQARDRALDALMTAPRMVVLTGPAGIGKTLLLNDLARELAEAGAVTRIRSFASLSGPEPAPAWPNDAPAFRVLLVDDCDDISQGPAIRAALSGCGLVVATSAVFDEGAVSSPDTIVSLNGLEADEVGPFVQARLSKSDLPPDLLSDEAIAALPAVTDGLPRLVNTLSGAAMFLAATEQAAQVEARHIRAAAALHGVDRPAADAPADDSIEPVLVLDEGFMTALASEPAPAAVTRPVPVAPTITASAHERLFVTAGPEERAGWPPSQGSTPRRRKMSAALAAIAITAIGGGCAWALANNPHVVTVLERLRANKQADAAVPPVPDAASHHSAPGDFKAELAAYPMERVPPVQPPSDLAQAALPPVIVAFAAEHLPGTAWHTRTPPAHATERAARTAETSGEAPVRPSGLSPQPGFLAPPNPPIQGRAFAEPPMRQRPGFGVDSVGIYAITPDGRRVFIPAQ